MQDRSLDRQLGRYQQIAALGQGGMGTVYLVLASGFGQFRKLLVIKELRQDLTCQKGFVRLFMDEAKLAARLAHPNVVQTFEAFQDGNRYLLAMEYLDGQALSALTTRLATEGARMPLGMHIHILCEVLSGLHYAHELRDYDGSPLHVVHRDVSPQNVFLTYHGGVKVVDFGVAKAANAAMSNTPGLFVGKFAYAAPEQISGQPVDARTDVFAVGIMLWQAIAERRFSTGTPTPEATQARAEGAEPRIREVVPDVDPDLADICDRAIEVDPDRRYPSAQAFRAALMTYLESRDVHTHDAEIGQLVLRMFAAERDKLHAQVEAAVEASAATPSRANAMTNDEREPTTKVDLSRADEADGPQPTSEHGQVVTRTNVVRLSTPEIERAKVVAPNKRRVRAGVAGLSVLALGTLLWLNTRLDPQPGVETKLLPATLVRPRTAADVTVQVASPSPTPTAASPAANAASATAASNEKASRGLPEGSLGPADTASGTPRSARKQTEQAERTERPEKPARKSLAAPELGRAEPAATSGAQTRSARRAQQLQQLRAAAGRSEPSPAPLPLQVPMPSPGQLSSSDAPAKAASSPSPGAVEAGADLGVLRRTTRARIDIENPY